MATVSFVGPSYSLSTRKAAIDRAVNLYLVGIETPGKAPFILESVPGQLSFATLAGESRGGIETNDRSFAVFGSTFYEVYADGTSEVRGTLATSTGPVSLSYGLFQVGIVDGGNGYVFTMDTNVFAQVVDEDFAGATTIDFIDNYFTLTKDRSGEQFQITAINDFTSIDGLDFSSAESSPDDLVGHICLQEGIRLFGTLTCELWVNTGQADFPFERSRGSGFKVGLMAAHSLREIDNGCMWLGRDKQGSGIVYKLSQGQPQRVSTQAVEQALQASTDLTQATAYTYQDRGLSFYCLNAPGLTSTWCFEVSTGTWHERCDLDDLGQFKASRAKTALFSFGKHLFGTDDGKLLELNHETYTNDGDPLVRERISPHTATPFREPMSFGEFVLDATSGGAMQGDDPQVELSWSDDSGKSWSNPLSRSLGKVGEIFPSQRWHGLGDSMDRVWKVRFSGDAPFSIIYADAK